MLLPETAHLAREQIGAVSVDGRVVHRGELEAGDVLFGGDAVAGVARNDGVVAGAVGDLCVHRCERSELP